jgi:pimeloyl-ACP methyl ester carboxylesterase
VIERLVSTGMKTPPDIGVGMLVADMFGVNRTSALKKIDCPTLIIASAKSDELGRQQAAANQIPHARFEKVEDAAHAVFVDQPDRFNELLKSFIAKLATNTARD